MRGGPWGELFGIDLDSCIKAACANRDEDHESGSDNIKNGDDHGFWYKLGDPWVTCAAQLVVRVLSGALIQTLATETWLNSSTMEAASPIPERIL